MSLFKILGRLKKEDREIIRNRCQEVSKKFFGKDGTDEHGKRLKRILEDNQSPNSCFALGHHGEKHV